MYEQQPPGSTAHPRMSARCASPRLGSMKDHGAEDSVTKCAHHLYGHSYKAHAGLCTVAALLAKLRDDHGLSAGLDSGEVKVPTCPRSGTTIRHFVSFKPLRLQTGPWGGPLKWSLPCHPDWRRWRYAAASPVYGICYARGNNMSHLSLVSVPQ